MTWQDSFPCEALFIHPLDACLNFSENKEKQGVIKNTETLTGALLFSAECEFILRQSIHYSRARWCVTVKCLIHPKWTKIDKCRVAKKIIAIIYYQTFQKYETVVYEM